MSFPVVRVVWIDSMMLNDGAWMDLADVEDEKDDPLTPDALRHEAVGYLIRETDDAVALAIGRNDGPDDWNRNTRLFGVVVIPQVAVLEKDFYSDGAKDSVDSRAGAADTVLGVVGYIDQGRLSE